VTGEPHSAPPSPSVNEAASARELKELRASVDALSREVSALTLREAPVKSDGSAKAAQAQSVTPLPSTPALQPVALPPPVPVPTQPALPSASPTPPLVDDRESTTAEANALAEHREAVTATYSALSRLDERMSRGETDGASAALEQAAQVLGGAAGDELREAKRLIENEELAMARIHIELALMKAR
jgi:hypothetical protein